MDESHSGVIADHTTTSALNVHEKDGMVKSSLGSFAYAA